MSRLKAFGKSEEETMEKSGSTEGQSATERIDQRIADLGDWRGETLSRIRALIKEADPDVVEEWKWMGTPIWSHDGIICTGESYTDQKSYLLSARYGAAQIVRILSGSRQTALQASVAASR